MKRILILVGKIGPKKKKFADYLKKEMGPDVSVTLGRFSDILFEVKNNRVMVHIGGENIKKYSLVFFRRVGGSDGSFFSIASSLAVSLDFLGIKYFDTAFSEVGPAGDKFTSLIKLSLLKLPIPHTIFCKKKHIFNQREYIVSKLGFPIVVKGLSSQRGKNVFLLKNNNDFSKAVSLKLGEEVLFQKYIPHDIEYRVLVLGGRADVIERKIKEESEEFRHNIHLGGKEEFMDIKKIKNNIKNISEKAAKARNLQMAGVDIMIEEKTGKAYILEVNRGPGISYSNKKSPELAKIAEFFKKQIK